MKSLLLFIAVTCSFPTWALIGGRPAKTRPGAQAIAGIIAFDRNGETLGVCSGALIGPKLVLTAAHCLNNDNLGDVFVAFAEHPYKLIVDAFEAAEQKGWDASTLQMRFPTLVKARKTTMHPFHVGLNEFAHEFRNAVSNDCDQVCSLDAIRSSIRHDLAVIELGRAVPIKPLKIWNPSLPYPKKVIGISAGPTQWGFSKDNPDHIRALHINTREMVLAVNTKELLAHIPQLEDPIEVVAEYLALFLAEFKLPSGSFFFTLSDPKHAMTGGDSGSPAILEHNGELFIVGVASQKLELNDVQGGGGYTSVMSPVNRQWLLETIGMQEK